MLILKVITQPIILYLLDQYFYIIGVMNNLFMVENKKKKKSNELYLYFVENYSNYMILMTNRSYKTLVSCYNLRKVHNFGS